MEVRKVTQIFGEIMTGVPKSGSRLAFRSDFYLGAVEKVSGGGRGTTWGEREGLLKYGFLRGAKLKHRLQRIVLMNDLPDLIVSSSARRMPRKWPAIGTAMIKGLS